MMANDTSFGRVTRPPPRGRVWSGSSGIRPSHAMRSSACHRYPGRRHRREAAIGRPAGSNSPDQPSAGRRPARPVTASAPRPIPQGGRDRSTTTSAMPPSSAAGSRLRPILGPIGTSGAWTGAVPRAAVVPAAPCAAATSDGDRWVCARRTARSRARSAGLRAVAGAPGGAAYPSAGRVRCAVLGASGGFGTRDAVDPSSRAGRGGAAREREDDPRGRRQGAASGAPRRCRPRRRPFRATASRRPRARRPADRRRAAPPPPRARRRAARPDRARGSAGSRARSRGRDRARSPVGGVIAATARACWISSARSSCRRARAGR